MDCLALKIKNVHFEYIIFGGIGLIYNNIYICQIEFTIFHPVIIKVDLSGDLKTGFRIIILARKRDNALVILI